MKSVCIPLIASLTICACARGGGPQLERPQFQVAVKLSDKAESKLRTQNETVKVVAYFYGEPNGSLAAKLLTDQNGKISIGRAEIELNGSATADFSKLAFFPEHTNLVGNNDYEVLINVMSGRRSDKLNLLKCEAAGGKLSAIQHKVLNVKCGLIRDE